MASQPNSPSKGTRNPGATRQALIDAATSLFAQRGFEGTRVDQIAETAGVNKAMISYHFGGKSALYNEILRKTFADAHRRFSAIRSSDALADLRLRAFIQTFADLSLQHPALPAMVLREVMSGGLHIEKDLLPRLLAIFGLVQEIIDQGIQEGTFSAVDSYLTHISLLGSLVFFFTFTPIRARLEEGGLPISVPDVREYVRHLQQVLGRGLAPTTPSPEPA